MRITHTAPFYALRHASVRCLRGDRTVLARHAFIIALGPLIIACVAHASARTTLRTRCVCHCFVQRRVNITSHARLRVALLIGLRTRCRVAGHGYRTHAHALSLLRVSDCDAAFAGALRLPHTAARTRMRLRPFLSFTAVCLHSVIYGRYRALNIIIKINGSHQAWMA